MHGTAEVAFDVEKEYEIVDGHPEEKEMAGARHGGVGMRLGARMLMHAESHQLGGVYNANTSFNIGRNERMPDVAFVAAERIPAEGEPAGMWEIAPDLAVEVISPNDLYEKVTGKVREYFRAGVRQVWLVSPEDQTITIYHSPTRTTILTVDDDLTSEDILPGFRCRVSEIFRNPSAAKA
jgi:Uma2 family endonuclease